MTDIVFECLKIIVMLMSMLLGYYIIPIAKQKLQSEKMQDVMIWVEQAVWMAQQAYKEESGYERKEIVVDFLSRLLKEKGIKITEEQLDCLIEAAVKQLRIAEKGV